MIDSVKSVDFALSLMQRKRKRLMSSMEEGSVSASNFSKISVSHSMVSRKLESIVSSFLFGASRNEIARNGGMIWFFWSSPCSS